MSMSGSLLLRLTAARLNLTVQAPSYSCEYMSLSRSCCFFESIQKEIPEKYAYVKKNQKQNPPTNQTPPPKPTK